MTDVQATTTRRWKQPPRTAKSNKMGRGESRGCTENDCERERDRDGSGARRGLLRLLRRQTHSQRQNGERGRDGGSVKCETKKTKRTPPSRGDGDEATWAMQRSVGEGRSYRSNSVSTASSGRRRRLWLPFDAEAAAAVGEWLPLPLPLPLAASVCEACRLRPLLR